MNQPKATLAPTEALRVLVVDDEKDTADVTALALTQLGHDVRKAYDGLSAVSQARQFKPQLILLDLSMPVVDGFEVAQHLRELRSTESARIFALTGHVERPYVEASAEADFDGYLLKPLDVEKLSQIMSTTRDPPNRLRDLLQ